MSATNWAKCPQCGVSDALREDYEVYFARLIPGFFQMYYGGWCFGKTPDGKSPKPENGCGFKFEFRHEERVPLKTMHLGLGIPYGATGGE